MPRPKKVGAPEPKKRSRNGCWPCKTRKVKCDEAQPTCINCQRQGEACDYSKRLKWPDGGKKKVEGLADSGQINFSSVMISVGSTGPSTADISKSTILQNSYESNMSTTAQRIPSLPQDACARQHQQSTMQSDYTPQQPDLSFENHHLVQSAQGFSVPPSTQATVDISMIDPALMGSTGSTTPIYQDRIYDDVQGRPEHRYVQSYERYRSMTPSTPRSVQQTAISRFRENRGQDDALTTPSDAGTGSPGVSKFSNLATTLPNIDAPASASPFYDNGKNDNEGTRSETTFDRPPKRMRYDQHIQEINASCGTTMLPPHLTSFPSCDLEPQGTFLNIAAFSSSVGTPLTPASSHSDEGYKSYPAKLSPFVAHDSPNLRRLSVSSLLSGPPGMPYQQDRTYSTTINTDVQNWPINQAQDGSQDTTTWGIDRGFKDLDIGKNDDTNAISGSSPVALRDHLDLVVDGEGEFIPTEFGFGMQTNDTVFNNGNYYDKPVPICVPRILEPLPNKLLENPMNLLYFHHFLNHTAGCLIPHNCLSNPFKSILPQMAVQDDNLLNLLLAYSASHRARLLRHPEPATRIALWVQDIFPNLRHALDDPSKIISNANLATAIMLASLEIISPKTFGVAVPWQKHLDTARQMIAARGGPQTMQTASRSDKVSSFLWSWFAYLDVLGSLSGGKSNSSSSAWILDYEIDEENDYQIDCILGFTSRCVRILAKIAELARLCDSNRIGPDLTIRPEWQPSEDIVLRAEKIEADLIASRLHPYKSCTHMQSTGEFAYQWDSREMAATNEAFHWAGLVHLHRRVLGKPSTHDDVQSAVREIFGALDKVRRGSSAEACLLFPMFTAGCDTQDEKQRSDIMDRIKGVERFGMTQVHKARTLMQRVWDTGKPWETLVAGEFFG